MGTSGSMVDGSLPQLTQGWGIHPRQPQWEEVVMETDLTLEMAGAAT